MAGLHLVDLGGVATTYSGIVLGVCLAWLDLWPMTDVLGAELARQ